MDRVRRRPLLYISLVVYAVAGTIAFEHHQRFFGWLFVIFVVVQLLRTLEEP